MKRFYKRPVFGLVIAVLMTGFIVLRGAGMTNVAETSPEHEDAQLKTRRYRAELAAVQKTVEETIPTLSTYFRNWRLIGAEKTPEKDSVMIKAEVPVVIFTDDLRVELNAEGGETVVNARSASRVGKSDLGENRRHLLQLFEVLDKKFASR
jgi:uncharacterized protein (DUF1499 family)